MPTPPRARYAPGASNTPHRRYRRRVNEHARDLAHRERPEAAREYVLEEAAPESNATTPPNHTTVAEAPTYATVVAETPAEISRLTVSEAVMRMDLAAQQVMMFRNSATGELNVVYRRSDGHIGWIDPTRVG